MDERLTDLEHSWLHAKEAPAGGDRRLPPESGLSHVALLWGGTDPKRQAAAQQVAHALDVEAWRVGLSSVVSSYIGETEKNLAAILARAATMDVILQFDEADALFGKRADVKDGHDRFADLSVDDLVGALEAHPGLVLLTTNAKAALDPAFLRRLRHVIRIAA